MIADEYVQPIVVLRAGSHEDAIHAVAQASLQAYLNTVDNDDADWATWLDVAFVKTVRRAGPGQFEALRATAAAETHHGDAAALAWPPTTYADLPAAISKLQVSGTELPRAGWPPDDGSPVTVVINEDLNLTTGKAAAQAAHGLFGAWLAMTSSERQSWLGADTAPPFRITGVDQTAFDVLRADALVVITDAGRTETEPGTETVLVTR